MNQQKDYKYYAFISYNSRDQEWGKRVQRKLEHYRMPATLCSQHGWKRTPIKPVFFAPTDIQPGGLNQELQERLQSARNLIVICSPNSAKSEWVGKEIEYFHQLGRTKQIHFFIVDGIPHSGNPDTECFNPIVDTLGLPEILGANIHEKIFRWPWLNKERAYVQLVSKLLGVEFDAIWQRHKRLLIKKVIAWIIGIAITTFLWVATINAIIPFSAEISINETTPINTQLPSYSGAITTLYLGDEVLTDTICQEKGKSVFTRIPKRYYNQKIRITFSHPDYIPIDTMIELDKSNHLEILRDPSVYGHVHFHLWNITTEEFVSDSKLTISTDSDTYTVFSDANGLVELNIPLKSQRKAYAVQAEFPLENTIIYMPCGEDDVLITK